MSTKPEAVDHPAHYRQSPSGVEAITICRHLSFNCGNAVKYVLRAGHKTPDPVEDLEKAIWYLRDEVDRLTRTAARVDTARGADQ